MPNWLYLPMTQATGEIFEYIERSVDRQAGDRSFRQSELALLKPNAAPADWLKAIKSYTARWVEANQFSADHWNVPATVRAYYGQMDQQDECVSTDRETDRRAGGNAAPD
jgi:hypothetical protein